MFSIYNFSSNFSSAVFDTSPIRSVPPFDESSIRVLHSSLPHHGHSSGCEPSTLCQINLLDILAIAKGPAPLGVPRLSDALVYKKKRKKKEKI